MFHAPKKKLSILLCATMLGTVIGPPGISHLGKVPLPISIDTVSAATGAGTITPVNPAHSEDEPGVAISQEDKALPYDGEFVHSYSYNNEYGFVEVAINENLLGGRFVNAITHIGINETKYTHKTVNKDRSSWFEIYIPYKYIHEGENDLYFYLDEITYKVRLKTSDAFNKALVSPTLVPQEVVSGKNERMAFVIQFDDFVDRQGWLDAFSADYLSITQIFTVGSERTVINPQDYDVSLNPSKDTLTIQFKDYDINQLYIYRVEVKIPGYIAAYKDVVLHEAPPQLSGSWQDQGNFSYRITVPKDAYNTYLKQVKSVTLIPEGSQSVSLISGKDYTAKSGLIEIYADCFEPGQTYTILLGHSSIATARLETTPAPERPTVIPQVHLFIEDVTKGRDVVFTHKNTAWMAAINRIYVEHGNVYPDRDQHDFVYEDALPQITLPAEHFSESTGYWHVTIHAKGFETIKTYVFIAENQDSGIPPAGINSNWDQTGDLWISGGDAQDSDYFGKVFRIFVLDKTTDTVQTLLPASGKNKNDYRRLSDTLQIYGKAFTPGHDYEIRMAHKDYRTVVLETAAPGQSAIQTPSASVENMLPGDDLVITSKDANWIDAATTVTIKDRAGNALNMDITGDNRRENSIIIPYHMILESQIEYPYDALRIQITADGYETFADEFFMRKDSISMQQSFERGMLKLAFTDADAPARGFAQSITKVVLNGRTLHTTEYMSSVSGLSLYISEKILLDGNNEILISSNQSSDLHTSFDYDNEALRGLKAETTTLIENSKLSQAQKSALLATLASAATVKEASSVKIQAEKEIDAIVPSEKEEPNQGKTEEPNQGKTEESKQGNSGSSGGSGNSGNSGSSGSSNSSKKSTESTPSTSNSQRFTDVSPTAWYHPSVTFIASRGITSGLTETTFGPNEDITRGQFIVMLMRAYEIEPINLTGDNFDDAGNTYYTDYLGKAKEVGITAGIGNNLFAPDKKISRQEMFTMLHRALKVQGKLPPATGNKELADFQDAASVADYSQESISQLLQGGIISGDNGKLNPQGLATRAQMAQLLYNLLAS